MNHEALEALRAEGDEMFAAILFSLDTRALNNVMLRDLRSNEMIKTHQYSQAGISITRELNLDLVDLNVPAEALPYRVASVKFNPELSALSSLELSQKLHAALIESHSHCFLQWLNYSLHWMEIWHEFCQLEAAKITPPERQRLAAEQRAALDDLKPASQERAKILARYKQVITDNFVEVWQKGFSRFLRESPILQYQLGNHSVNRMISLLDNLIQAQNSSEP